jgi:hypothetical protein
VIVTSGESIQCASAIFDGSAWRMWYVDKVGSNYLISYATSDCCSAVEIFSDGFENGNTFAWSAVFP